LSISVVDAVAEVARRWSRQVFKRKLLESAAVTLGAWLRVYK
jgi:hypothetical protein